MFSNTRTVGSKDILHFPTIHIVPSTRSIIVLIKSITTERWYNVVRPISKLTLLDSKLRKKNCALIHSSAITVKANTKQKAMTVLSGNIGSIESSCHKLYSACISTTSSVVTTTRHKVQ